MPIDPKAYDNYSVEYAYRGGEQQCRYFPTETAAREFAAKLLKNGQPIEYGPEIFRPIGC